MQGLKVKCPNCGRTDFITTDKYNPDVRPNGGMVKCTLPYYIDWLTTSSTVCAEMTCPECMAQLAPSGVLTVMVPVRECGQFFAGDFITPQSAQEAQPLNSFSPDGSNIRIPMEEVISKNNQTTARGPMEILESMGEKIAAQQDEPEPVERRKEVQSGKKRGKTK
jgi:hypothetical protein